MSPLIFIALLFLFLFAGIPIAFSLGLVGLVIAVHKGIFNPIIITHVMYSQGIDSFPLLAVPFFILAGSLMEQGGISQRLVDFAQFLVGRIRGGLAQVAIVSGMFFGGITGSAVADAAAVGSMLIPSMKEKKYDSAFSSALSAASGAMGPIIPPSIPMVIYSVIANVSVAKLFLAGIVPGVLFGVSLMVYSYFYAKKKRYPKDEVAITLRGFVNVLRRGILPLLMPLIILGGIFSGVFTATESAVVAVVYAFIISHFVYRTLPLRNIPKSLTYSAKATASIMFIIGLATFLSWVITSEQIPQQVAETFFQITDRPWAIIILLNVLMLILGFFIDPVSILILISPIALPIIQKIGMDPVHFGVILTVNICIGSLTPPVGTLLFVCSRIGKVSFFEISKAIIPMCLVVIGVLFLISFVPETAMYLPRIFGTTK
ncbi:MAG: TRAP transporter large permease [Thermodesulfobacteriota bacterium]